MPSQLKVILRRPLHMAHWCYRRMLSGSYPWRLNICLVSCLHLIYFYFSPGPSLLVKSWKNALIECSLVALLSSEICSHEGRRAVKTRGTHYSCSHVETIVNLLTLHSTLSSKSLKRNTVCMAVEKNMLRYQVLIKSSADKRQELQREQI